MTEQEAIMVIQAIPNKIWNQLDKCECESIDMAIEALEKQIPKKILRGTITRDTACYCSVCKSYVCFEDVYKDDYCPKCGQRIDWE